MPNVIEGSFAGIFSKGEKVRKEIWGYAANEKLGNEDLIKVDKENELL